MHPFLRTGFCSFLSYKFDILYPIRQLVKARSGTFLWGTSIQAAVRSFSMVKPDANPCPGSGPVS